MGIFYCAVVWVFDRVLLCSFVKQVFSVQVFVIFLISNYVCENWIYSQFSDRYVTVRNEAHTLVIVTPLAMFTRGAPPWICDQISSPRQGVPWHQVSFPPATHLRLIVRFSKASGWRLWIMIANQISYLH